MESPLAMTQANSALSRANCVLPQRVSGAWVFRGTRIPMAALFQNLEVGISLAEFVEIFPGVTTEQSRLVLKHFATRRPNSQGLQ